MGRSVLESTELYQKKSGAEIVDQLFNFTDKASAKSPCAPSSRHACSRGRRARARIQEAAQMVLDGQFFRYEKQHAEDCANIFNSIATYWGSDHCRRYRVGGALRRGPAAFGFTEKDFVVRISDRDFWTDFLREEMCRRTDGMNCCRQSINPDVIRVKKTAEKLGKLADPIFSILETGGESRKLDQLLMAFANED